MWTALSNQVNLLLEMCEHWKFSHPIYKFISEQTFIFATTWEQVSIKISILFYNVLSEHFCTSKPNMNIISKVQSPELVVRVLSLQYLVISWLNIFALLQSWIPWGSVLVRNCVRGCTVASLVPERLSKSKE